ncbi:hypothetical protein NDU88_001652 [Pleurodeles waltl]|uniref:Uncharacterized protein n=1 Tax=Pleurodeles waltl TaxID=8319 RepID=A0AAV7P661_PLEWA|nr:hypothetical protein NDU88_001652 [Pleurodeles waltl]
MDNFKIRQEVLEFFRHIRLKVFFEGSTETSQRPEDTGFRPKSTFTPNLAQLPQEIKVFERAVTKEIETLGRDDQHAFMNLTRLEYKALEEFNSNPTIIIKPADKERTAGWGGFDNLEHTQNGCRLNRRRRSSLPAGHEHVIPGNGLLSLTGSASLSHRGTGMRQTGGSTGPLKK